MVAFRRPHRLALLEWHAGARAGCPARRLRRGRCVCPSMCRVAPDRRSPNTPRCARASATLRVIGRTPVLVWRSQIPKSEAPEVRRAGQQCERIRQAGENVNGCRSETSKPERRRHTAPSQSFPQGGLFGTRPQRAAPCEVSNRIRGHPCAKRAAHLAARRRTSLWIFPFFMMTTRFLSGAASRLMSCSGSPATTRRSA